MMMVRLGSFGPPCEGADVAFTRIPVLSLQIDENCEVGLMTKLEHSTWSRTLARLRSLKSVAWSE